MSLKMRFGGACKIRTEILRARKERLENFDRRIKTEFLFFGSAQSMSLTEGTITLRNNNISRCQRMRLILFCFCFVFIGI